MSEFSNVNIRIEGLTVEQEKKLAEYLTGRSVDDDKIFLSIGDFHMEGFIMKASAGWDPKLELKATFAVVEP